MEFNRFKLTALLKLLLLTLVITGIIYTLLIVQTPAAIAIAGVLGIVLLAQLVDLFHFITKTNKKLSQFLESIQYSDFTLQFRSEKYVGKSFNNLNEAFNNVLHAFHKERAEKQAHLQYLNTIVKHVNIGLIAFNTAGEIEIINENAKNFLGVIRLKNIKNLQSRQPELYAGIVESLPGKGRLVKTDKRTQLAINTTTLKIKTKQLKIVVLKNIYPELQAKELESWQNLTNVLRHEIMNSMTPIASIISTLQVILKEDLVTNKNGFSLDKMSADDLKDGLLTIDNRAKGLVNFIDAYRSYTNIPSPQFSQFLLRDLFEHIFQLMKSRLKEENIHFEYAVTPETALVSGDYSLLEMVLINLVSNAIEAKNKENTQIKLLGTVAENQGVTIQVIDNGQGIDPAAIDKIFIPFFTTKGGGSGIGLSLSSQIMGLHDGTLTVQSEYGRKTMFLVSW